MGESDWQVDDKAWHVFRGDRIFREDRMLSNTKTYKVPKATLLGYIRSNREKHVRDHDTAVALYRKRAEVELQRKLTQVKEGQKFSLSNWPGLLVPRSYAKEYDQVIGLLDLTLEDVIEITPADYRQYVLDEWAWKPGFSSMVKNYSGVGAADEDDQDDGA